jgi:prepilin peptidase CpaA
VLTWLMLKFRSEPLPALLARHDWIMRLHNAEAGVPYGIALAAAALIVYPDTIFMQKMAM